MLEVDETRVSLYTKGIERMPTPGRDWHPHFYSKEVFEMPPEENIQPSPGQGETPSGQSSPGETNAEGGAGVGSLTADAVSRMIQSSNDKLLDRMERMLKGEKTPNADSSGNVPAEAEGQPPEAADQPEGQTTQPRANEEVVNPIQYDIDAILKDAGIDDIPKDSEAYKLIDFETQSSRAYLDSIQAAAEAHAKTLQKQSNYKARIPDAGSDRTSSSGPATSDDPLTAFKQGYARK